MLQRFKTLYKNLSAGRKLLLGLSLLHLLIIFSTAPYILGSEVDAYALTFPSATWLRHMFIAAGICMITIILLWLYNHYIPNIFCRYTLLIRIAVLFLIGYYGMYQYWTYPYIYYLDGDYTALADMSSHGYPLFWQGYLTGIVYLSYFLCLCHPISVLIMQAVMLAMLCGYILDLCFAYVRRTGSRIFLVLLFLLICTYNNRFMEIFVVPHRIAFWSVPFLYVLCTLIHKIFQNDSSFLSRRIYLIFSAIIGMLAYWRTESILLLLLLPTCAIFYLRSVHNPIRPYLKRLLTGFAISAAVFMILSVPEKMVSAPVYQNDYMLVNYSGWMQGLIKEPDFDISYEGGQDDLDTFYYFIPNNLLPVYGSGAYHYSAELNTGNCTTTGWTDAERKSYEDAVFRIIRHNLVPFLRSRITAFLRANSYIIVYSPSTSDYYEKHLVGYGSYHYRIMEQYSESGTRPVYIRKMLDGYKGSIHHLSLSAGQIVTLAAAAVMLLQIMWVSFHCIRSFIGSLWLCIFTGMASGGTCFRNLITALVYTISFSYGAVCYLCRFSIKALQSDLITCFLPFAELIWYSVIVCLMLFHLKRRQYAPVFICLLITASIVPVILFAPMAHYMYYNGLMCGIYALGLMQLLHLSQGTADAVRNDYQDYLGRRMKRK